MGHAGAIVTGGKGTAIGKKKALEKAGIAVVDNPSEMGAVIAEMLKARNGDGIFA
jgi:succinyl-CoA synthetase alpha subunit